MIGDNVLLDDESMQLLKVLNVREYFGPGKLYSLGIHMQATVLKPLIPHSFQTAQRIEAVCLRLTFNLPN